MYSEFRILLVDDEPEQLETLKDILHYSGYTVSVAESGKKALQLLAGEKFHLAILDVVMPGMDGLALLERLRAEHKSVTALMLTGNGTVDTAVRAMKFGAADYLLKPVNPEELLLTIARERERRVLVDQNAYFMAELSRRYGLENFVGRSPAMEEVFEKICTVAATDAAVLITGESGTGKELVACHIHYSGDRQGGPFVPVNCADLAHGVVESELFGHERGAFTGAVTSRAGRFERADGGTLFLDEVSDIPFPFQAKLLRVLQSKQFERMGGARRLKSNFRLISATNRDLHEGIREGTFREDLFFRLNVVEIELPPLRRRREDIPPLVDRFVRLYSEEMNKRIVGVTPEALAALEAYDWPGNVRELKNAIERAIVYCRDDRIGLEHLPSQVFHPARAIDVRQLPTRNLDAVEKALIELCLLETGGNRTQAAKLLGIQRGTLRDKMIRYGLS